MMALDFGGELHPDLRKNGLARLRSQHCLRRYYGAL